MPNSNAGAAVPLIVSGNGTAGTPDTGVVSVQGIASGTPLITEVSDGTNLLGTFANYGTSPGAVKVLGVNAFITNSPTITLASTQAVPLFVGGFFSQTISLQTTATITYTPTAGNMVVVGLQTSAAITAVTVKDQNGNALTASTHQNPTGGTTQTYLFYGFAVPGATSYVFAWTTAVNATVILAEYANIARVGAQSGKTNASTTQTTTTLMTSPISWVVSVFGNTVASGASTYTATSPNVLDIQSAGGAAQECLCIAHNPTVTTNANLTNTVTFAGTVSGANGIALELIPAVVTVGVNVASIGGSPVSTAASGVQKVGIVGNTGATLDSTIGAATAPTNALATSVVYQSTIPALTAGQAVAQQGDTTGGTYVNTEGRKKTYSTYQTFTAAAGVIAVLPGNASTTVRLLRVEVSLSTTGTAAIETVSLIKTSAAPTGGTSAAMTVVPHDSSFAAASSAPLNYTVAPTPGTPVGTIRGIQFADSSTTALPGSNTWLWDWGMRPGTVVVLRGVAQTLEINLGGVVATQTATVSFEWTEE